VADIDAKVVEAGSIGGGLLISEYKST